MSIGTAKAKILSALPGMKIDCIDDTTTIHPEGLLLSFEGMDKEGFAKNGYLFGLYVSKKILNKNTASIYSILDDIDEKILIEARKGPYGDEISLRSIRPVGFDNGILEYRLEIRVVEI
ncbi:MAG: hypothetical protein NT103_08300 [Campylobacterales bacterium]|nr:hypothetical protein [Campylobacterales bacterium]